MLVYGLALRGSARRYSFYIRKGRLGSGLWPVGRGPHLPPPRVRNLNPFVIKSELYATGRRGTSRTADPLCPRPQRGLNPACK